MVAGGIEDVRYPTADMDGFCMASFYGDRRGNITTSPIGWYMYRPPAESQASCIIPVDLSLGNGFSILRQLS